MKSRAVLTLLLLLAFQPLAQAQERRVPTHHPKPAKHLETSLPSDHDEIRSLKRKISELEKELKIVQDKLQLPSNLNRRKPVPMSRR
jgi:hypothetical protein